MRSVPLASAGGCCEARYRRSRPTTCSASPSIKRGSIDWVVANVPFAVANFEFEAQSAFVANLPTLDFWRCLEFPPFRRIKKRLADQFIWSFLERLLVPKSSLADRSPEWTRLLSLCRCIRAKTGCDCKSHSEKNLSSIHLVLHQIRKLSNVALQLRARDKH